MFGGENDSHGKEVTFHLGKLKHDFESSALNEDNVENGDETHFCINLDNGRTLGLLAMSTSSTLMLSLEAFIWRCLCELRAERMHTFNLRS
jgi:hypothetical protein